MEVKDAIKSFKSYKANTREYLVKLDANESIYNDTLDVTIEQLGELNRYPDNYSVALRKEIAMFRGVNYEEVMVGAGSSELLELIVKTFINPGEVVLSVEPSFVMYQKYTMMHHGIYETLPKTKDYRIDIDALIQLSKEKNPKVIFLCTPNNPTGYVVPKKEVIKLLDNVDSVVVIDEAYMEFWNEKESVIDQIDKYPNLIVNRTYSKAYGLAGCRLGYIISNKDMIETLGLIKTPYSVNSVTQFFGIQALQKKEYLVKNVNRVLVERDLLYKKLEKYPIKVFPSGANFIFCEFDAFDLAEALADKGVLIRSFKDGTYRITVGDKKENQILIEKLEEIFHEKS